MKNTCKTSSLRCYDLIFAAVFAVMTAFLIWKAPYGYGSTDESFYLTIPYRLMQGDSLLTEEWHVSQLSGLLLYPIMLLYRLFGGTSEGIIVSFRYIYVTAQCVCALAVYLCFRRCGDKARLGAICAVAVFMPYAPFYIMALSYNTMGLMTLTMSAVILITAEEKLWKYALSGLLFAGGVLCCPYNIIIYLIYSVIVAATATYKRKNGEDETAKKLIKKWLAFTLGAALLALYFDALVVARADLSQLGRAFNGIMSDPQHEPMTFYAKLRQYYNAMIKKLLPTVVGIAGVAIVFLVRCIDKQWKEHRWLFLIGAALYTIAFALYLDRFVSYINYINAALSFLGLCAYILSENRNKKVFLFWYIPGVIYSFLIHLGSNNGGFCITSALNVTSAASAYLIGNTAHEMWKNKKCADCIAAIAVMLGVLAVCAVAVKEQATTSYSGFNGRMTDNRNYLYSKVEVGPSKGLKMAEDEHYDYIVRYTDTESVRSGDGKKVVYYVHRPWLYLADEKKNAAFSAWMSINTSDSAIERLLDYWDINPEKEPDIIYIDKNAVSAERASVDLNVAKYTLTETDTAYLLTK